jgi:uncharacterized protein YuzE
MYPQIEYDEKNGLAYITFSDHEIEKTIESEDELLVFDIDKQGELVGIEIMSVWTLQQQQQSSILLSSNQVSPEMIAMFLIPPLFQYAKLYGTRLI